MTNRLPSDTDPSSCANWPWLSPSRRPSPHRFAPAALSSWAAPQPLHPRLARRPSPTWSPAPPLLRRFPARRNFRPPIPKSPRQAQPSPASVRFACPPPFAFSIYGLSRREEFIADYVLHLQLYESSGSTDRKLASPTDSGGRVTQWPFVESAGDNRDT